MISKSCKYAIRASVYIATYGSVQKKLGVRTIAEGIDAPVAFTAKILRSLNKHRIITSLKGPYGGFYCEKPQLKRAIIEVVNSIDGLSFFKECGLGLHECSDDRPCPIHYQYAESRRRMQEIFENSTIGQLAEDLSKGKVFINNLY